MRAFILRSKETLARDPRRAASRRERLGNESGYGPNAQSAFDYVKAGRPDPASVHSQQGLRASPLMDFDDSHYPTLANLRTWP